MYMKSEGGMVVFLILYVDDILLLESDIWMLSTVKVWLGKTFDMKYHALGPRPKNQVPNPGPRAGEPENFAHVLVIFPQVSVVRIPNAIHHNFFTINFTMNIYTRKHVANTKSNIKHKRHSSLASK